MAIKVIQDLSTKIIIMRQILFILGLGLFLISCKKDQNSPSVRGVYKESSPVSGRSNLNFISGKLVVKSESGISYKDTFNYSISTGKILLTPTWTKEYPGQQFEFKEIDENTIKIESLYPSIPEAPKNYMTFKK